MKNIKKENIFEECLTIEIYFEKDIAKLGSRHQCECISQKNCQKVESWWLVGQSGTLFSNTKYNMSEIQNTIFLKYKIQNVSVGWTIRNTFLKHRI